MNGGQYLLSCVILLTTFGIMSCNIGRPPLPDSQGARHLFHAAETNRTPDGFITKQEVTSIFHVFDKNDDGHVDENEFIERWRLRQLGDERQAVALFKAVDTDKDSQITEVPDLSRVFIYFDRNDDGRISEAEFIVVWQSISLS